MPQERQRWAQHTGPLALACVLAGVLCFSSGFLSVRKELPDVTTCSPDAQGFAACRVPAPYDKAVILIVDALREDFLFLSAHGAASQAANDLPRLRGLLHDAVSGRDGSRAQQNAACYSWDRSEPRVP